MKYYYLSINDMQSNYFHFTNKKNLNSINTKGLIPNIGVNAKNIEKTKKIFFVEGLDNLLILFDCWINALYYIPVIPFIYKLGAFFLRHRWFPNVIGDSYFKILKVSKLHQKRAFKKLDRILDNGVLLNLDLVENIDFRYDDKDEIKSRGYIKRHLEVCGYSEKYSDLNSNIMDKWNMHTLTNHVVDNKKIKICCNTNKRKTNYHIHLIFSERKLLPEPDIKRATRSVFYDETGKRVRTKKEITGEDGQIRKGCTVIKKGEVYESHLFTVKDDKFKSEPFLREVKEIYTDLINRHISDPEQQLKVFDKNSVYLPTKKIGKNNPKAAEIEADNTARQEWNRTADMALLSDISEAKILEVKQTEIHEKASQSIKSKGWLPNLFRGIVTKAKDFLQNLIREKDMPLKPTLDIDMAEFRHMRNLMIKVQDKAVKIKNLQDKVLPQLKQQLADTKGIFKGKERKALEVKIKETETEIADRLDKIPDTLKADGYPDVQAFMRTFREMESVVEQYNRDLAEWERQVSRKPTATAKAQYRPPEKQSVLKHLREIQERNKQKPPQRQRKKSFDRDSR